MKYKRFRRKELFLLFFIFLPIFPGFAQADPAAVIIYSEGFGFSLSRYGEMQEYNLQYDNVIGMELNQGDFISTEESTFLEIQLLPSENILKVAENTSFEITRMGRSGGASLSLTYGKIRAKVSRLVGDEEFQILGQSVIAGVRGTDFGYDIIAAKADEETGALTQVYCFEGEVEVSRVEEERVVETVVLGPDEMVVLWEREPRRPLQKEKVSEEIDNYWERHRFEGELISVEKPEVEEAEEEVPEEKIIVEEELTEEKPKEMKKKFLIAGTGLLATGLLTESIGVVTYFWGDTVFPGASRDTTRTAGSVLMISGGGIIGIALFSFLGALLSGQ
ncbi:MAG: hypothetical protein DRP87_10205 [Spirochaetes bacterium]|nr:MAG: hypothetical protein DRP87_10205 [Spirochaetota bacterium]